MSRARAGIVQLEEAKHKIAMFNASGAKAPVIYMSPQDNVDKPVNETRAEIFSRNSNNVPG